MQEENYNRIDALQTSLGYRFLNPALLHEALIHKSFSNEHPGTNPGCNERLEFLGDAVLDLAISQLTFLDYPDLPEGELTRIRAELVQERSLATIARKINLGSCLKMGRGERKSGGEDKASLLANALEAVFGAVFLDQGYPVSQKVIAGLFSEQIKLAAKNEFDVDHKTRLQEFCQRVHHQTPVYVLIEEKGPDHLRHYTVELQLRGQPLSIGKGRSKKLAEQNAAKGALAVLEQ